MHHVNIFVYTFTKPTRRLFHHSKKRGYKMNRALIEFNKREARKLAIAKGFTFIGLSIGAIFAAGIFYAFAVIVLSL